MGMFSRGRTGAWFVALIEETVREYARDLVESGGAATLRKRWPDATADEIADRLIARATRQAALAGLAAGTTTSAAWLAALAPPSLVAALPAAIGALGVELLYTTRLQVRLVVDLAALYGYPLDLADPEDLTRAFALAYGVNLSPEEDVRDDVSLDALRAHLRMLAGAGTRGELWARAVGPQIGRALLLRALARAGVPGVAVGAAALVNVWATRDLATVARHEVRALSRLRRAAEPLAAALRDRPDAAPIVLAALVRQAAADGHFGPHERELHAALVRALDLPREELARAEVALSRDPASLAGSLAELDDPRVREALADCLATLAAADGHLGERELAEALAALHALGADADAESLRALARSFAPPPTFASQATEVVKERFTAARTWWRERGEAVRIPVRRA